MLLDVRVVIDDEFGLDAMAVRIVEGPRIKVPSIRVQMFRMLYAGLVSRNGPAVQWEDIEPLRVSGLTDRAIFETVVVTALPPRETVDQSKGQWAGLVQLKQRFSANLYRAP